MANDYNDDYGFDDGPENPPNFSRMPYYRYNNAYGNYRGGYDRSNQCPPPPNFGPPPGPLGPPGPPGPLGPPGPPFPPYPDMQWRKPGGSYGGLARKAKRDKIIKHLLRCGVARENVVNLPHNLLFMMHPLNCGLCAVKFETYDLSRIHYISKNHLKNQKKWMNQRSDLGTQHSREPLKARELYCELCDVHITSTGHAESHYAGKNHRSIVEGRKNARNTFLLQPNMQGRLKALIRRENKFLKKLIIEGEQKPKPDPSTVAPHLFCEICKTSMMCSEQMTTHLNGKRHLNKEKQHILKLMKGAEPAEGPKNASKVAAEEEVGEDEDDEDEDEGEGEAEGEGGGEAALGDAGGPAAAVDDGDDWADGGEDWKPSAEDY